MHLLLTDRLTCPRCGPTFGLILLADRLEERVVYDGSLGCSNCRDSFPIVDGFADLRAPPRREVPEGLVGPPDLQEDAQGGRLLALLGVVGGPGAIALVGEPARCAVRIAGTLGEIQVAAVDPDLRRWPEAQGVSRLMSSPGLPFFASTMRAAAVDGRLGATWLSEAARVVAPKGRVVVTRAPEQTSALLGKEGLTVLAAEAETVVAARS